MTVTDGVDCDAAPRPVTIVVELPFWMMVPDGRLNVTVEQATFTVEVDESYVDLFVAEVSDSRRSVVYNGPVPPKEAFVVEAALTGASLMFRKAKTVIKIASKCSSDAFSAMEGTSSRVAAAHYYFVAFCAAHIPVLNRLIDAYRWATADPMAVTATPRTVPIWFVRSDDGSAFRVVLLPEAEWDYKPYEIPFAERANPSAKKSPFEYADLSALQAATLEVIQPSELALLEARSLIHRGDYSGAVRRAVTALEVLLERELEALLVAEFGPDDAASRLLKSRNDFPGRLRQYEKLSSRPLGAGMQTELDAIRDLRHEIVHRGRQISFGERGTANKAVDVGRFIYNWLENNPLSVERRERRMAQKVLGGLDLSLSFCGTITADGVQVTRADR